MAIIILQGEKERQLGIHYEIDTSLPPIGAGGMGQVLRGVQVNENSGVRRPAAIKFLFDDLPESAVERTRREASVQIQNENLVEMYGFVEVTATDPAGNETTRYHVASELLNGVMLHDLLRGRVTNADGEILPFAEELYRQYQNDRLRFAVFIIRNILSGIMALHDAGFIHRDIDPSNIMITAEGKVKLIDFGICKNLNELANEDRHLTSAGQFMGKAAYAAPELVTGDVAHQDATTDLYAVGIMFFELLSGNMPFEGPTHEVLEKQLKEPIPVKRLDDKYARKIIQKATSKKQADRYASAAEFRVAVEQLSRNSIAGKTESGKNAVTKTDAGNGGNNSGNKKGGKSKIPLIPVAAGVGILIVLAIVIGVVSSRNNSEEELVLHERAKQDAIENRKAELEGAMIDSKEIGVEVDTLTGISIPTVGYELDRALKCLRDRASVNSGLRILEDISSKGYKSSAQASALLAAIYGKSATLDSVTSVSIDEVVMQDYVKANKYNTKAIESDPECYQALYELGCDYLAGDSRGVVERDLDKAHEFFDKGYKLAQKAGDQKFINRFSERLSIFN